MALIIKRTAGGPSVWVGDSRVLVARVMPITDGVTVHIRVVTDSTTLLYIRRIGGSVLIGEGVELCVNDVRGSDVDLSIEAPRDVLIVRDELKQKDAKR